MTVLQIGPYSRPHMLAKIDGPDEGKPSVGGGAGRTELTRHVGGAPTSIQRTLIGRVARLMLYIASR